MEPPPDAHPTTAVNDGSCAVAVSTIPDGADISVDGNFVGSAPATLKLAPGKHVISVSRHGLKAWSRELSVLPGSEVTLKAELEKNWITRKVRASKPVSRILCPDESGWRSFL